MNLQQLKVFVHTVKLKKLYLVAMELGIRQPTVTFHLNKLQADLGVALFVTNTYHTIKLTEAGKALYHYATSITSQSEEIESLMSEFRQLRGARLSIGCTHSPATYILPPYLAALSKDYEHLSIMLDVKPAPIIIEKIKQFELDFGIISHVDFQDKELIVQKLIKDDLVLVFYPEHDFSRIPKLVPSDLAGYPLVSHEEGSVSRKLFDDWAVQQQVSLSIIMEISGSEAMKATVKHRMGYAILSESNVKSEVESGMLCIRPIPEWTFRREIYLIRGKNKLISPAMKMFLDQVVSKIILNDSST